MRPAVPVSQRGATHQRVAAEFVGRLLVRAGEDLGVFGGQVEAIAEGLLRAGPERLVDRRGKEVRELQLRHSKTVEKKI